MDDKKFEEFEKEILNSTNSTSNYNVKPNPPISTLLFNNHILALLIILIMFIYGHFLFESLYQSILNLIKILNLNTKEQIISTTILYLGLLIISGSILILNAIPIFKGQTIQKIISLEIIIFIAIIITFIILLLFTTGSSLENNQQVDKIKTQTNHTISSLLETISCSFNPTCIEAKMNSNKAQTVNSAQYYISLKNPYRSIQLTKENLKKPLEFYYNIQSSGPIYLDKVECYIKDTKSEPISTYQINQKINTGSDTIPLNFNCENLDKIKLTQKKNNLNLITLLYISVDTQITQEIPIVEYNKFIKEKSIIAQKIQTPSYINLKNELNKFTSSNKKITKSNNAINLDTSTLILNLPILINDNKEREFTFPLIITKNQYNDFGTFKSAKIKEFKLPNILSLSNENQIELNKNIPFNNEKFFKQLNLKENENNDENYQDLETIDFLKIKIESNFEKKDYIRLNILNKDFNNNTTTMTTTTLNQTKINKSN